MYVARVDALIVNSKEVNEMRKQYAERFGEWFIAFNYGDFHTIGDKCAGRVYKETLEAALRDNKPYHIVSHRYDEFDY